jgi:molybdenum cofactor cytidylyltransferase
MRVQPVVVVLAAGQGSRFMGPAHKLEQSIGPSSVLGNVLQRALASQLAVVVVTTEHLAGEALRHLASRDVVIVPEVGSPSGIPLGMGYSIAAGVTARSHASGWLVLPGDMPLVQSTTLVAVAQALEHHPVAFAQYRGRRGHPVGFSAELFNELSRLSGDAGASRLVARYPAYGVEVDDPGVLVDIDTEEDLRLARDTASAAFAQAGASPRGTSTPIAG